MPYPLSEKLEKAGTVDFKKTPCYTPHGRWRQGPGSVDPRFPNPRICSILRFGKIFPAIFPEFSSRTPAQTPETATAFSSFLTLVRPGQAIEICNFRALSPLESTDSPLDYYFLLCLQLVCDLVRKCLEAGAKIGAEKFCNTLNSVMSLAVTFFGGGDIGGFPNGPFLARRMVLTSLLVILLRCDEGVTLAGPNALFC